MRIWLPPDALADGRIERGWGHPAEPDAAQLRRALDEQELTLHYQPKLTATASPAVTALEALVGENDPQLGLLLPAGSCRSPKPRAFDRDHRLHDHRGNSPVRAVA